MTTEIVQFKCPSCGHSLGEKEYSHACESIQKQLTEKLQQQEGRHAEENKQLKQKYAESVETQLSSRISQERLKWNLSLSKFQKELALKEQELQETRVESINFANERVRQAITESDEKHRQTEEQYKEKIYRLDDYNRKLQIQIEEQRKRFDSIPGHLSGQAGENILFEDLTREFKVDEFICKKNGKPMADIIQNVVTESGERISTPIVYDKKTSNKVTKLDLEKAKNYKMMHKTDHCIIVTNDISVENRFTEVREGVLLVRPSVVLDIATRIRSFLIEASKYAKANSGIETKKDKLYQFFTSSGYNRDVQIRLDIKSKLDALQLEEEQKHRRWWNKRNELICSWEEVDAKWESYINDLTQEDEDEQEDNENPSS